MDKKMYLNNRPVFGNNWARFFIFVGSRGCGKTFMSQNYCLRRFFKYGEKFLWLRLTEGATKKLLQRDGADFIDAKLMDKWNITKLEVKGDTVFLNGKEACKILALSTFYNSKGVALNGKLDKGKSKKPLSELYDDAQLTKELKKTIKKYKTIVLDEMNREKNEKKSFDICYAFTNQIETICRTDTDRRIIMAGNTLDEASDVLAGCFNFIPEKLGLYKLHNKKAIVYYADDSDEYKQAGFWDFKRKEYYVDHEFSVDRYIKLINTYTEYLVLDEGLRKQFESYISNKLTNKNVVITQKCSLFLARK